jgi:predicted metal-dependent hydrolase
MDNVHSDSHPIIPRENLDFGLDGEIPRYWFDGDPFKTRLFDALSVQFPEGEKYFINSVRAYRDRVTDPVKQREIRDFIRQEGQHSRVHMQFNDRLREQGINVDRIEHVQRKELSYAQEHLSPAYNLAMTAASEHMTAIMAHTFFDRGTLDKADPRLRAMYAWHAVEEIEHKAVAFDVLREAAGAGYGLRLLAMLHVTLLFPIETFLIMRYMFRADGFSFLQRAGLWLKGFWWMYRPGGVFMNATMLRHYFAWYRPGFHPWQNGRMEHHRRWIELFTRTGDPVAAGEVARAA